MKTSQKFPKFTILRHYNSPNTANYRGLTVKRESQLFVPGHGMVVCAPYDDHFIFEIPQHIIDASYKCTCGSVAVVVGANAYKQDASPTYNGKMLICLIHGTYGFHATGGSRWI